MVLRAEDSSRQFEPAENRSSERAFSKSAPTADVPDTSAGASQTLWASPDGARDLGRVDWGGRRVSRHWSPNSHSEYRDR